MADIQSLNVAWVSLTYICNNFCKWCYAASNVPENSKKTMPLNKSLQVVNFLSELETKKIIYIGGEPTLYPGLETVLEKTKEKGMKAGIISNGRKFKDRGFAKKIKEAGADYISISITSPNPGIHDAITRVKGSFYETMQGIETASGEGLKIATNTVIARDNQNDLEGLVDLFKGKDIQEMTFNVCGVCITNEENNSQLIYPNESVKAFERVYSYAKSQSIRGRLVTPMPLCLFDQKLLTELKERKLVSGGPCQLIYGRNLVVEYNGDIVPCTHLAHHPLLNIFSEKGIMSKENFLEVYNSHQGTPFIFRENVRRYPSKKCGKGSCNEPCAGGCPIFWTKFDPEKEIKGIKS